jgi:hypothetical protein
VVDVNSIPSLVIEPGFVEEKEQQNLVIEEMDIDPQSEIKTLAQRKTLCSKLD